MEILLVEDDLSLIRGLTIALKKQDFTVTSARTLREALTLGGFSQYALILLDVSLPDGSGFDLCVEIRRQSRVPIIFLTAADEEINITAGLDIGGDDYITKPFKLAVLISRINALLRRTADYVPQNTELCSNGIHIDLLRGQAKKNEKTLDLTAGEYKLLCLFMQNPNIILSPEQILGKLWDCSGSFVNNNTLTVYIRRLRSKIEDDPKNPQKIVTVRLMGYKWNTEN